MKIKVILGFDGFYCVDERGCVWSKNRTDEWKKLKGSSNYKSGHVTVQLHDKSGNIYFCYVHRLVLQAFIGPCPEGMECRHLDGNPTNNNLSNLKWGTRSENIKDSIRLGTSHFGEKHSGAKLTESVVLEARKMRKNGSSFNDIKETLGIEGGDLWSAVSGNSWSHLPNAVTISPTRNKERAIRVKQLLNEGISVREIKKEVGLKSCAIYDIKNGKSWKDV